MNDTDSLQRFGQLELARDEAEQLSTAAIVERLIAIGTSRLTAERIVAIERGNAEPGRARNHGLPRR
jgi:hypothetical protein